MSAGDEPCFLSFAQVMALHRRSLEEHGGLDGIRDAGAIESALASAENTWIYGGGDVYAIAAAYTFHLAESQAFLDGNKRTAAGSAVAFLVLNGCVDEGTDEVIYDAMISIAKREMNKAGLAAVLRQQFPRG